MEFGRTECNRIGYIYRNCHRHKRLHKYGFGSYYPKHSHRHSRYYQCKYRIKLCYDKHQPNGYGRFDLRMEFGRADGNSTRHLYRNCHRHKCMYQCKFDNDYTRYCTDYRRYHKRSYHANMYDTKHYPDRYGRFDLRMEFGRADGNSTRYLYRNGYGQQRLYQC